jgi:hypothetical protein
MHKLLRFGLKAVIVCWAGLIGLSISVVDSDGTTSFWGPPAFTIALALLAVRFGPALHERASLSLPPIPPAYTTGHRIALGGVFIASLGWLVAVFLHHRGGLALVAAGVGVCLVGMVTMLVAHRASREA